MENDKLFAVYATLIFLGIGSVVTFAIYSGVGALPAGAFMLEHVALGLLIRGAYKGFDGENGIYVVFNAIRTYTQAGARAATEAPADALPA